MIKQMLTGLLNSPASYKPSVSGSAFHAVLWVLGTNDHLGQYNFNQRKELRMQTTSGRLSLCLPSYKLSRGQRARHISFLMYPARMPFQRLFLGALSYFHTWMPLHLLFPEVNPCPHCPAPWQCDNSTGLL